MFSISRSATRSSSNFPDLPSNLLVRFEVQRLLAFSKNDAVENGIRIQTRGQLVYTRHRSVPFFNKIHGLCQENQSHLTELLAAVPPAYPRPSIELAADESRGLERLLSKYNYVGTSNNIVVERVLNVPRHPAFEVPASVRRKQVSYSGMTFVPVNAANVDTFAELYLDAFQASSTPRNQAIGNMRYYPTLPGWTGHLAVVGDVAVGIGATYVQGREGYLCCGAVAKDHWNQGIHQALIQFRIGYLIAGGIRRVLSYAKEDSISLRNLQNAGLSFLMRRSVYQCREPLQP